MSRMNTISYIGFRKYIKSFIGIKIGGLFSTSKKLAGSVWRFVSSEEIKKKRWHYYNDPGINTLIECTIAVVSLRTVRSEATFLLRKTMESKGLDPVKWIFDFRYATPLDIRNAFRSAIRLGDFAELMFYSRYKG